MTDVPQEPAADTADELERALWRAFCDWSVARAKWAAALGADRENWDEVVLLGVMGGCQNAGVTYDEFELALWRLAHAKDHRDFAELRDLIRKHGLTPKGHAPTPEVMQALRAGNFEAVRAEYKTTSVVPKQAEAPETETDRGN